MTHALTTMKNHFRPDYSSYHVVCYDSKTEPVWDFNANQSGYQPGKNSYANKVDTPYRDASAASITASALLELSTLTTSGNYKETAVKMLESLSSATYLAQPGTNAGFLIKHCVGSIPHQVEIDVPLVYADYYYIEALHRYGRLQVGKGIVE